MTDTLIVLRNPDVADAARVLWDYHDMHHAPTSTDVGVGLGSHDLSVASTAAKLYHDGRFPLIVFTGANALTTLGRFPRGEAVHYGEHALELGVPDAAILVEPTATNTAENITRTRDLLWAAGHRIRTVTLISRPYQQRRAFATCRKVWPEVDPNCASAPMAFLDYVESIGDEARVLNMLVGDTQRIEAYAERGFAIPQEMPQQVRESMAYLIALGYTTRLI